MHGLIFKTSIWLLAGSTRLLQYLLFVIFTGMPRRGKPNENTKKLIRIFFDQCGTERKNSKKRWNYRILFLRSCIVTLHAPSVFNYLCSTQSGYETSFSKATEQQKKVHTHSYTLFVFFWLVALILRVSCFLQHFPTWKLSKVFDLMQIGKRK